jgi:hypothetical protein
MDRKSLQTKEKAELRRDTSFIVLIGVISSEEISMSVKPMKSDGCNTQAFVCVSNTECIVMKETVKLKSIVNAIHALYPTHFIGPEIAYYSYESEEDYYSTLCQDPGLDVLGDWLIFENKLFEVTDFVIEISSSFVI